jgi:hypothetical protein
VSRSETGGTLEVSKMGRLECSRGHEWYIREQLMYLFLVMRHDGRADQQLTRLVSAGWTACKSRNPVAVGPAIPVELRDLPLHARSIRAGFRYVWGIALGIMLLEIAPRCLHFRCRSYSWFNIHRSNDGKCLVQALYRALRPGRAPTKAG